MSWVPAEQVLQTVAAQRHVLAEQQARIAKFEADHRVERQKLDQDLAQAKRDLGQAVLGQLDAPSILAAANAVGLVGMPDEDIPAKLEARRAWLRARLEAIARDPRYATRELLRHPHTGSLVRAKADAVENRRLVRQTVEACEEHPRFERLWTTKFGTAEESAPWWRYASWLDRSAAKEIVVRLSKTTFAEVRTEYEECRQRVATFDAEIAQLSAEIATGEALEQEYATLWNEHHTLDARGLEHTRNRLVSHLLSIDASIIQQQLRAASSPFLLLFLRTSGIASKIAYLDGIQRKNQDELQQEIAAQKQKLDRAEAKTRKRWAPMPSEAYQKLAEDRRPRYEKRWQRTSKIYDTVRVYDRWDRGRYYDNLLWWDLMTRGRYDGSYIPEVATFHQTYPTYQYDPDWKLLATTYAFDDGFTHGSQSLDTADDALAASAAIDADSGSIDSGREGIGGGDGGTGVDVVGTELASTDAS